MKQFLLLFAVAAAAPGAALAQDDPSLPSVVLPEGDQPGTMPGANEAVISLIKDQISQRYLEEPDEAVDLDRLNALVSGDYISDYEADSSRTPVRFSNSAFQPRPAALDQPLLQAPPPAADESNAMPFVLTPDAIRAMSNMSRDQIEAIALMVQLAQDPGSANINPQGALSAIPGLSENILEHRLPDTKPATGASHEPAGPKVVDVGNGRDMALENWAVITSPQGRIELSNSTLPGSRFAVEEGMVVGRFGRVVTVSAAPGDVFVEFETGDRIEGDSVPLDQGIPAVEGGSEDRSRYGGEILVSEAAPISAAASRLAVTTSLRPVARPVRLPQDQESSPEVRPLPASVATSGLAPATSLRPKSKPRRL